jgi:hypothetical protein
MNRLSLTIALVLLVAAFSTSNFRAPVVAGEEDEVKAAQKALLDLTKDIEDGKNAKEIRKKAQSIKQKNEELDDLMHIYKPQSKGGLGIGPKGDSIEAKLNALGKKGISKADLARLEKDLVRVGNLNIAMTAVLEQYKVPALPPLVWQARSDDLKKTSQEFIKAVKTGDPAKVRVAAHTITNACDNCHVLFRRARGGAPAVAPGPPPKGDKE